jgi:hypothetical protein
MRLFNLLIAVILVGIVGCESREAARRRQAVKNLKQIGAALDAYHAKNAAAGLETTPETPGTVASTAENVERPAGNRMKFSGEVVELHRSPDGEVDGLALEDGTEVRFPPESGERVAAIVSIGDEVEFVGWTHAGETEVHVATVMNVGSGKSVEVDQLPPDSPEAGDEW